MIKNLLNLTKASFICIALFTISTNSFSQNLILNPSFENGTGNDFDDWFKFNGAANLNATSVASEVKAGSRALKVTSPGGNPWETQMASKEVATTVGTVYTYSFYIKAATAGTTVRISTTNDDTNYGNDHYSADFTVTTEWQKFSGTFTGYDVSTRLLLDLGKNANTYFVDEVSLTPPSVGVPGGGSYIFDDAYPLQHQFQGYGEGAVRTTVTNTPVDPANPVKVGQKALSLVAGPEYSAIALVYYNDSPTPITPYPGGVSFWVYGKQSTSGDNVSVNVGTILATPPPSYGWTSFSATKNFQVPVGKWVKGFVSWADMGNPASSAGVVFGTEAGNSFIIDEVKYLNEAPCAEPANKISGTVVSGTTNPSAVTDAGMYITFKQGDLIENVVPVVNGAFSIDANLCNGTYEVSLSTTPGGSSVPAAPAGKTFSKITYNGVEVNNTGKINITFAQNEVVVPVARKNAEVTNLTFTLQETLPVSINKFAAKVASKGVNVEWSTSAESNFSHFEVQKSINGKEFNTLAIVKSNVNGSYNTTDINPTAGINYYRLKMVDLDGSSELSKIVSVDVNKNKNYFEFANPVANEAIMLKTNVEAPSFTLYTSMGKKIAVSIVTKANGTYEITPTQTIEGIYFLNISSKNGNTSKKVLFK